MINIATITSALKTLLESDSDVTDFLVGGSPIDRGDYINNKPDRAPWMGIYRSAIAYDPRTLGLGSRSWQGIVTIRVVVQAVSFDSGRDCEDRLEDYVNKTLTAILTDKTLGGNVDMLNSIGVGYSYNEVEKDTMYFQNATITLIYEVATS